MEFSNLGKSWLVATFGMVCSAGILFLVGCVKYRALKLDPPQVEQDYRARTLSDAGLRAYIETNAPTKVSQWPPTSLDLPALTLVAFYYSPEMDVARTRIETSRAAIITAGARPNPSVSGGVGPSDFAEAPYIASFQFDLPIETAGKRKYRILRAQDLSEATRLALGETAWQVRSRVRGALLDHLLAVRELELWRAEETFREQAVTLFEQRFTVGEVSRPDIDLARTDLSKARLAVRSTEGRVAETRSTLAAAVGLPTQSLDNVTLSWSEFEYPPNEETVSPDKVQRAGLLNRLDVRRALAEYSAIETTLRLEIAKQYPDIHLAPGYEFAEGANSFPIILDLTLPILDRNRGPIAEAEAQRKEAAARFLALQSKVIAEMDGSLARYRAAIAEFSESDRMLSSLQRLREEAMQRAVQVGEQDRLQQVGLQLEGAVVARARLDALRRVQTALGDLEDSVQVPLGLAAPLPPISAENPREHTKEAKAQ